MNDPTDTEGQRLIEEQIRLKNIIMARNYAIEHMPEAYIPVNMLYISIKINGVLTQAFIDTGNSFNFFSIISQLTINFNFKISVLKDRHILKIAHIKLLNILFLFS